MYATGQWHIWQRHEPGWRAAPRWGACERADGVLLDVAPRWLPRFRRYPSLDWLSLRLAALRLRRQIPRNRHRGYVLYLFHPDFEPYVDALKPARLIYHAYDLFERTPEWCERLQRSEDSLLRRADACFASSSVTAERLQKRSGRTVQFLPNGADVEAFRTAARQPAPEPADLADIARPRIGYIGRQNRKLDFALIARLAQRHPDWQFVLIGPGGPLDKATKRGRHDCLTLANVHDLGSKHHRELPAYTAALDVGLIPYRLGAGLWTEAAYPLKVHEYLGAERTVVAAPLESLAPLAHVIRFAQREDDWAKQIAAALREPASKAPARSAAAAAYDWSRLADTVATWIW